MLHYPPRGWYFRPGEWKAILLDVRSRFARCQCIPLIYCPQRPLFPGGQAKTEELDRVQRTGIQNRCCGPIRQVHSMDGYVPQSPFPHFDYYRSRSFSESEEGGESTIAEQLLEGAGTAATFQQLSPAGPPHQLASTFRQPTNSANQDKSSKRRMISPELTDDNGIHSVTWDRSSSSSLADPDELPAKRLRRSTIIAHDSDNTAATPVAVGQDSFFPSNGLITVGDNYSLGIQTPPSPSLMTDTDSAWEFQSSDLDIPGGTTLLQGGTRFDIEAEPSPTSPNPPLNTEPIIPDFLTAKHNIYGYLVDVNEPGFKALLDNYIAFELAEHSGVRGVLPTAHRPTAVTWWTSRARPDRIPPFDGLGKFGSGVVEWWIFIQSDWRKLKCGETDRGSGSWESLYQPGINGLLNVIILVYWWARTLEEGGESGDVAYHWLVDDVTWVLAQLTRVASEGFSPE